MQLIHHTVFHGFREVLRAPARALSAKQILVMTTFLCLSLAVYDLITYLAYLVDGQSMSAVFQAYGFFPFGLPAFTGWLAWVVYIIGGLAALLALMQGLFDVAAINIEKIRGNRFLSIGRTFRFAFSRVGQVFYSEMAILIFVAFIVALFFLVGLVSRIPFLGEWIYALFFVIPSFIVGLLTVFVIFVVTLSVLLLPAVAAAEREGEAFAVILETFSTLIRQPFRWMAFTALAAVLAKLASFVYAYFCFRTVQFVVGASMLGGGERLNKMVKDGLSHLPANSELVREMFNVFPGVDWSFSVYYWMRPGVHDPVSYLMAVMIFIIFASVISYALATIAAGQALGYVAIRQIKDDYNIADEEPMFYSEEHVNPEIGEKEKEQD
jgi:hypothetical protein